jgi:site-specific DNA recombinase
MRRPARERVEDDGLSRSGRERQYSGRQVLDILTTAGLRTRGDKRTPPKPVSISQFWMMLADRYHLGVLEYDGEEYEGRHEALVTPDLFDRVQRVLALHGSGTRQRRHNHFLKGTLWCGRCGRRFIIMRGKGNGGTYFYFLCRGRQEHECDQPYLRVEVVEAAVAQHYATVRLTDEFREQVRRELDEAVLTDLVSLSTLKKRLNARLEELGAKEDQYLELVGSPGWPKEKLRRKLDGIQAEREQISAQLADATTRLEAGRQFFLAALALLRDPRAFYEQGGTSLKRAMNKVVFTKLFVDGEEISGHELAEPVRDLIEAERLVNSGATARLANAQPTTKTPNANSPDLPDGAAWTDLTGADLLAVALAGHGSSRTALVGDTGFEPVTSSVSTKIRSWTDQQEHAEPQVSPRRSAQFRTAWSRTAPLGAPRCSPSAPPPWRADRG